MARFVEVRRHTDNDGDVLSEQGVRDACRIGAGLTGIYAFVVTSGAQRATQTAASMLAAFTDEVAGGVRVDPRLRSEDEGRWRRAVERAGSSSLDAIEAADPDLVAAEAPRLAAALEAVLADLDHGEMALVIGHSPMNEAAVHALTGTVVEPLAKGAGVMVVEDADGFRVEPIR